MSIHEKLAARLREMGGEVARGIVSPNPWNMIAYEDDKRLVEIAVEHVAKLIERGDLNNILGVREPTIEDVQREAKKKTKRPLFIGFSEAWSDSFFIQEMSDENFVVTTLVHTTTIAAAYAALRELPDYEGEK